MFDKKPNIHLMEMYDRYYLYDVNTNGICMLTENVYSFLKQLGNDTKKNNLLYEEMEENDKEDINYLLDTGFLKPLNDKLIVEHFEADKLKDYYAGNMQSLILQVTQNCNLRCQYCVYSGSYVNRVHNNKRMSVETAIQAVDFLAHHSVNSNEISIGFYGGEPLLEIELIKKTVEHAKKIFAGKIVRFNMTTNATLLNVETVEFLYENNFALTISLDGPSDIQNKNRIFANSNKGTFDYIMKNLEMIIEKYPDFVKQITFNAVIDLKQDVSCSDKFFLTYDMVKNIGVAGNYVNTENRKDEIDVSPEFYAISNYEIFKVYLYSCQKEMFQIYKPTLHKFELGLIKQQLADRFVVDESSKESMYPGGQCLPGIQRFFVNVDGKFYPCERVDEEAEEFCIGSLEEGINVEKAKNVLNVATITSEECKNCWCYKMCNQCISKAEANGKIDRNQRLKWCYNMRSSIEDTIKNYIVLKDLKGNIE